MKTVNFVLCGLGGQGILFMTKILAQAGLKKGYNIIGAETHGMAQRGGSVLSHLRFGNVQSSLVKSGSAHFLLALEENEAYRNLQFLAQQGQLYANASTQTFPTQGKEYINKKNIACYSMPVSEIAMQLGSPMSTNLALISMFAALDNNSPFNAQELRETVDKISPDKFKQINMKIFDTCFEKAEKLCQNN